jgi:hypothetical protein
MDWWLEQLLSAALYLGAAAALVAGALLGLSHFIDYLATERWPHLSVLDLAYDMGVVSVQWYFYPGAMEPLRAAMAWIPASVFLIVAAPLLWRLGIAISRS